MYVVSFVSEVHCLCTYRITNAKPSAIFRLKGAIEGNGSTASNAGFATQMHNGKAVASIGLLCEELATLEASAANLASSAVALQTSAASASSPSAVKLVIFPIHKVRKHMCLIILDKATSIAQNLYNYLSSFGQNANGPNGRIVGNYVEMSLIEQWLRNFESKTRASGTAWLEHH